MIYNTLFYIMLVGYFYNSIIGNSQMTENFFKASMILAMTSLLNRSK
jgi:hypothetical protein